MIHGADQPYNDLAQWKYTAALDFFGPGVKHESILVKTPNDWEKLLDDDAFGEPSCTKVSHCAQALQHDLVAELWLIERAARRNCHG
jgi:TPP-dependent 2-oxoacid decarboxylase